MQSYAEKKQENLSTAAANSFSKHSNCSVSAVTILDNRPEAVAQRKLQELAKISLQMKPGTAYQKLANSRLQAQKTPQLQATQKKENNTGLPGKLKAGIENLSGYSMDDVKVHYNSSKPSQLQAHAYAQGPDIHLAPGQEKHLPHETWHTVQQMQGRVEPTVQSKGVAINDDTVLEHEADVMGAKALQMRHSENSAFEFPSRLESEADAMMNKSKAAATKLKLQTTTNPKFIQRAIQIGENVVDLEGVRNFLSAHNLPLLAAYEDKVKLHFINQGDHNYENTAQGAQSLWRDIKNKELFDQSGDVNNQWKWLPTLKGYQDNDQNQNQQQWDHYYTELLSGYCANLAALYRINPEYVRKIVGKINVYVAQDQLEDTLKTLFEAVDAPDYEPQDWTRVLQKTITFKQREMVVQTLSTIFNRLSQAQIATYYIELSTPAHGMGIEVHENGTATILEPNHHTESIHDFAAQDQNEKATLITNYIWETGLSYNRAINVNISVTNPQNANQLPEHTNISILGAGDLTKSIRSLQALNPNQDLTVMLFYNQEEQIQIPAEANQGDVEAICQQKYQAWGGTDLELLDIDVRTTQPDVEPIAGNDAEEDAAALTLLWDTLDEDQLEGRQKEIITKAKEYNESIQ